MKSNNQSTKPKEGFFRICPLGKRDDWETLLTGSNQLCNPVNYSLPGSSVYAIFQERVLEWVAISFSTGSPQPRDWPMSPTSPALVDEFFISEPSGCVLVFPAVAIFKKHVQWEEVAVLRLRNEMTLLSKSTHVLFRSFMLGKNLFQVKRTCVAYSLWLECYERIPCKWWISWWL